VLKDLIPEVTLPWKCHVHVGPIRSGIELIVDGWLQWENACRRGPIYVTIMPLLLLKNIDDQYPGRCVSAHVHQCLQEMVCLLSLHLCSQCQVEEEEAEHVGFCWSFKDSRSVST
jgi:hypothetical protein